MNWSHFILGYFLVHFGAWMGILLIVWMQDGASGWRTLLGGSLVALFWPLIPFLLLILYLHDRAYKPSEQDELVEMLDEYIDDALQQIGRRHVEVRQDTHEDEERPTTPLDQLLGRPRS